MERQFNNGDFEKLLRDNANQYRMYPSEKVWKGIHSALHTRRRWYGLSAGLMLLITGSIVSLFIFNDRPADVLTQQPNSTILEKNSPQPNDELVKQPVTYTPEVIAPKAISRPPVNDIAQTYLHNPGYSVDTKSQVEQIIDEPTVNISLSGSTLITDRAFTELKEAANEVLQFLPTESKPASNFEKPEISKFDKTESSFSDEEIKNESSVDSDTEKKINEAIIALASQNVPLAKPTKRAKVTAQVFFTPTVSYRKLSENKRVYTGTGLNFINVPTLDVNNMVNHKPAMGLEFGIEGRYSLNEKLSFKTGFQFNINRYDIRAYSHPTEIATVAVSSGYRVDSMAAYSNYRNFSGSATPNWLENFYFQVGIPVGVELILADKNNLQWGVSGTIQPTYVIGDKAYVISSDYKNYAKYPDLMRRWNVSTGFGTFISYSTGKIKWQVGPHVRFQHFSSFVNELSVREKLFSAGLKVGASLNKN